MVRHFTKKLQTGMLQGRINQLEQENKQKREVIQELRNKLEKINKIINNLK